MLGSVEEWCSALEVVNLSVGFDRINVIERLGAQAVQAFIHHLCREWPGHRGAADALDVEIGGLRPLCRDKSSEPARCKSFG
jgi:hypothetical protein